VTSLLIDAGNSRLKWSVLHAGGRSAQQSCPYAPGLPVPAAALACLQQLLEGQAGVEQLVLVHVLGEAFAGGLAALEKSHHCRVQVVRSLATHAGITNAYARPEHLGADRFVGLLAARRLLPAQPAIVIDCGTAVTLDGLHVDGRHCGGLILPGLGLLGQALTSRTQAAHMAELDMSGPMIFADNTRQAMGSGCLLGLTGALEGIRRRMQAQLGPETVTLLCGGDAGRLHALMEQPEQTRLVPDLLMTGLQHYVEQQP